MYHTHKDRLRHRAQAIAARRRARFRSILRRLRGSPEPLNGGTIAKTHADLARRAAQARAMLTTRRAS